MVRRPIAVGLSTASVYPENTEAAFRYAADLGYDGVELMVWAESVSQDVGAVAALVRKYAIPVQAVHAPCLLISQRVWGSDPVEKLERSVRTAETLGATTVVVHPPFRWQRKYAEGFAEQVVDLESKSSVVVAVENMFPMRADSFFGGKDKSAERLRKRGGPGAALSAFSPSYDPTDSDHAHYTLDLSHTATAGMDALELALPYGQGARAPAPGRRSRGVDGRAPDSGAWLTAVRGVVSAIGCERIQRPGCHRDQHAERAHPGGRRASMLAQALAFAREHLARSAVAGK